MEEAIENSATNIVAAEVKIGAALRAAREQKNLTVNEAAASICLAPRQIEALENDDLSALPELPFVRGFVRSYAKLLGLDALPLLAQLPDPYAKINPVKSVEASAVNVPFNVKKGKARKQSNLLLMASVAIGVSALFFALWNQFEPQVKRTPPLPSLVDDTTLNQPIAIGATSAVTDVEPALKLVEAVNLNKSPAVENTTQSLVSSASAVVAASPSAIENSMNLHLVFDEQAWLEVKNASGKILSSQLNAAGTELTFNDTPPYDLVIGNAKAVHVYRQGVVFELAKYTNAAGDVAHLRLE
jgi:cytoskeleton protein RodZ